MTLSVDIAILQFLTSGFDELPVSATPTHFGCPEHFKAEFKLFFCDLISRERPSIVTIC